MQETHCAFVFTVTFCWSIAQLLSAQSMNLTTHHYQTNMLRGAQVVASTFAINTTWVLDVLTATVLV